MSYITMLRDGLWPGGQLKAAGSVRTAEERLRSRDEANRKLSALIPGATPHTCVFLSVLVLMVI